MLPKIAEQALQLAPHVCFSVLLDDPDPGVVEGFHLMSKVVLDGGGEIYVDDAPVPALGVREEWMRLRQAQYKIAVDKFNPTHGTILDDDGVFADVDEARQALHSDADLVYGTKMFLWDDAEHYNSRMPTHRSVVFFRCLPGDAFPMDRTIHAPLGIHDHAKKIIDLKAPILDFGYIHRLNRERCFRDYVRVGKIDAATRPLVEPPDLRPVPHEYRGA